MVHITIDNYEDRDSLAIYELAEGSFVIDLKTEIEATEGIPIGRQQLVYNNQDLQDDKSLDSLIFDDSSNETIIISLLPVQICIRLERHRNKGEDDDFQEDIQVQVDLTEPVYTIVQGDLWQKLRTCGGLNSAKLSILGSDTRLTIGISDINQSFLSYGIHHNDVINVVYERRSDTDYDYYATVLARGRSRPSELTIEDVTEKSTVQVISILVPPERRIVRAKYNWDGEIMHPTIKGLSLKCNALIELIERCEFSQPGWLYGSPIDRSEHESFWHSKKKGYFPESYVSVIEDEASDQHFEVTDITKVPPLPPFRFPLAKGKEFFMPIADGGDSFLKLTVDYELTACPLTTPTDATISLFCSTYNNRRVSSIRITLTIPQNTVTEVKICENEAHQKEFRIEQEITENRSKEKHFEGVNIGAFNATVGIEAGISNKHSIVDTEKGTKVSRRKVEAGILKEDTIFWNLKAPMTKLDEDGLNGEESITLGLKKKPLKFKYKCRVTHTRNGVEKTVNRISRD